MKILISCIAITILLTAFTVNSSSSQKITQLVVSLPGLNSTKMQYDLEQDIHKLSGILFIETSLMSQTMVLHYDARKLSHIAIDHILLKWGCSPGEPIFRTVLSTQQPFSY